MAAHSSSGSTPTVSAAYRLAAWRTLGFWLIATPLLTVVMAASGWSETFDVLAVAVGSFLVAVISLAPALTLRQDAALASWQSADYSAADSKTLDSDESVKELSVGDRQPGIAPPQFLGVIVGGIAIRLVGTVALFVTCRYQLASTPQTIAAMTIGWYVSLTSVELSTVASRIARAIPPGRSTSKGCSID